MNYQNLLIYDSEILFEILEELKDSLNFKITNIPKNQLNFKNFDGLNSYIILSLKKNLSVKNIIILNDLPVKFTKLLEIINIEFLKQRFNEQSNINIGSYKININSREITYDSVKLKLTEKEIDTIIYLNNKSEAVSIDELQKQVWGHLTELETHTVETHIHRLRKKIKDKFNINNLIISEKNGYKIK